MSKSLRVGNIFTFTGCKFKYVCTNYIDHNPKDGSACCYDETYYYMELDKFNELAKESPFIEKKKLLELSNTMKRTGFNKLNVTVIEDEAPYELMTIEVVKARRKKPKTVTVYE